MNRSTLKKSTIFVAIGDEFNIFRSFREVPPDMKRTLRESSRSWNSATIMIADRAGRDELVRAIEGRPSRVESRFARSSAANAASPDVLRVIPSAPLESRVSAAWKRWSEILLVGSLGLGLWLLFLSR